MVKLAIQVMLAVVAIAFLLTNAAARPGAESDLSNMVEALRVLEQYDKMYSQLARPR